MILVETSEQAAPGGPQGEEFAGLGSPPEPANGLLLLVGCEAYALEELAQLWCVGVLRVDGAEEALALLAVERVSVLCLGGGFSGRAAREMVAKATTRCPDPSRRHIVLAAGDRPEIFQEFVDRDQLYYLSQKTPPAEAVLALLESASTSHEASAQPMCSMEYDGVLEFLERLVGESDRHRALGLATEAARRLTGSGRTRCLIYEPATETLCWHSGLDGEQRDSAASGLVSFVARTARPVMVEKVGNDPRYDQAADNAEGDPGDSFLAVPVVADRSGAGRVLAVLVSVGVKEDDFSTVRERLGWLAAQLAPTFERLARNAEFKLRSPMAENKALHFRPEALEHHLGGGTQEGRVLRLSPRWLGWADRLLLAIFATAMVYAALGSLHEYARGVAVVRSTGQTEVTSTVPGTVNSVEVVPGQRVVAGQLLVRLDSAREVAELERIQREFEIALLGRLEDPTNPASESSLGRLAAQKRFAEARLEARWLRASGDGTVGDLRVRAGQSIEPGQAVLTLRRGDAGLYLVVLFPGHYRPLIAPGMPLRLELTGYGYAYQHLVVEQVGDQVLGPAEARRFLGAGISDAVVLAGPVVLVVARLARETFESGGELYSYHDGILGTAEVRVRSERLLTMLLPGLKAFSQENADG